MTIDTSNSYFWNLTKASRKILISSISCIFLQIAWAEQPAESWQLVVKQGMGTTWLNIDSVRVDGTFAFGRFKETFDKNLKMNGDEWNAMSYSVAIDCANGRSTNLSQSLFVDDKLVRELSLATLNNWLTRAIGVSTSTSAGKVNFEICKRVGLVYAEPQSMQASSISKASDPPTAASAVVAPTIPMAKITIPNEDWLEIDRPTGRKIYVSPSSIQREDRYASVAIKTSYDETKTSSKGWRYDTLIQDVKVECS